MSQLLGGVKGQAAPPYPPGIPLGTVSGWEGSQATGTGMEVAGGTSGEHGSWTWSCDPWF